MAKPRTKKKTSKKLGSLAKRILTALVMLPVAIGALWVGYPFVDVLALIVGVLLAWEWANMVSNKTPLTYLAAYITSLAVSLFVYDTPMIVSTMVLVSFFVWVKAKSEEHHNLLTLGVAYISIGVGSLLWIYHGILVHHPYNFYMTLWFFIMVWAMDIGGFIVGCNLKGPKLAPKISPNKTWSGLIGGIVFAMAASYLYIWLLAEFSVIKIDNNTQTFFVVLGGIIAAVSQIGDLIESAIKRKLGVKDSSALIPGHGGVFDRVDGLIFAAPFVYWLFAYGL
ncbi:MAG: phosphatidate cytidylyltransferase [Alphaproteobacteria bacterium]|nr:phosphatidate cytidylyltransferase [Alphaproteobacteria bacterium]